MFRPFSSGVLTGWASMCGALVPPLALFGVVAAHDGKMMGQLCDELMAWYQKFPFPEYQPAGMNLPQVPIDSSLCHVSVTKWMKEAGVARGSEERKHRCGGLTADTVIKAVNMLNEMADKGAFTATTQASLIAGTCMNCHGSAVEPFTHGKENCMQCHGSGLINLEDCLTHERLL